MQTASIKELIAREKEKNVDKRVERAYEHRFYEESDGGKKMERYFCDALGVYENTKYVKIESNKGEKCVYALIFSSDFKRYTSHRVIGTNKYKLPLKRLINWKRVDVTITNSREGVKI